MMIGGTSARVTLQALVPGWGGVESGSWLALFRAGQSSAGRFVGIAISTILFSGHEGELFHLNCTMRFIVTMTRLALNRIARERGVETRLATSLWAGKSSANACASVRGQQGAAAMGHIARFLAHPGRILRTALNTPPVRRPHQSHAARHFCFSRAIVCPGLSKVPRLPTFLGSLRV